MRTYKILNQKAFESTAKFEDRLNEIAKKGWEVVASSGNASTSKISIILIKSSPR